MLPHLERNIVDLVQDAEPIRKIFLTVKDNSSSDLFDALSSISYIEGQASKVTRAQRCLADREAQQDLNNRKETNK